MKRLTAYFIKDIECLEQVHVRATKLINGFKNLSYEDSLKLTTLEKRRLRGELMETLKVMTGRKNVDKQEFFVISSSTYNLRGHHYTISMKRNRTASRAAFCN